MAPTLLKVSRFAILIFLLLVVLVIAGAAAWVMTGPRSINAAIPYITSRLTPNDSSHSLSIRDATIAWDGELRELALDIQDISLSQEETKFYLQLPRIRLGVEALPLLFGQWSFSRIIIYEPRVLVQRDASGAIRFGLEEEGGGEELPLHVIVASLMGFGDKEKQSTALLNKLEIKDAFLYLQDRMNGVTWQAPDTNILVERTDKGLQGNVTIALQQAGAALESNEAAIVTRFTLYDDPGLAELRIGFRDVYPSLFADLSEHLMPLHRLVLPVNGWIDVSLNAQGGVQLVDFNLQGGAGTIEAPKAFPEPVPVQAIKLKGSFADNLQTVLLEDCHMQFEQGDLSLQGYLGLTDAGISVDADVQITDLPVDSLSQLWPLTVAPQTRNWITERITGGRVSKAGAKLRIHPGDLQLEDLPDGLLEAIIEVEGASVEYSGTLPKVDGVDATVRFAENAMDVTAHKGHIGEATATGKVGIPDMLARPRELVVDLDIISPAGEVARYLQAPEFDFSKELNLIPEQTKGQVQGHFHFQRPIGKEFIEATEDLPFRGAQFGVDATLEGFATPALLHKYALAEGQGTLTLDNSALTIKGKSRLQDIPMQLTVKRHFYPKTTLQTEIDAAFTSKLADLQRLDIAPPEIAQGSAAITSHIAIHSQHRISTSDVDLTQASLKLASLGFEKPVGEKAMLKLTTKSGEGDSVEVEAFNLKADSITAEGNISLNAAGSIRKMEVTRAQFAENDFAFRMANSKLENGESVFKGILGGKSLDLRTFYDEDDLLSSGIELPHMALSATIERVILGDDNQQLRDFSGQALCTIDKCLSTSIKATLPNKANFTYTLGYKKNKRGITITSNDAGELFRTLGIYDNLLGGDLTLAADFDDSKETLPLLGTMKVKGHRARKAPRLAKLLNIASLTGVFELLQDEGIQFDRMEVPFQMEKGIVTIRDAKTAGPSLGITANGWVDTNHKTLSLEGTLVPSYGLNSFVGNIPLLGKVIVGGEGQGLFAATFKVKGASNDPDVTVNPLSMLAPGFLRGLFGDNIPKPPPSKEKAPKAAVPKPSGVSSALPQE